MSHFHHWAKSQPDLLEFIRGGGCPAICGCDVCDQIYGECRQAVEKWLAEHDFTDFNDAERLKGFLRTPMSRIFPTHVANEMQRRVKPV